MKAPDLPADVRIETRTVDGVNVIDLACGEAVVSLPASAVVRVIGPLLLAEAFPWRYAARRADPGPSPSPAAARAGARRRSPRRGLPPSSPAGDRGRRRS